MTERKKEDEKKPAKLPPFVEPQLFVAVEEANRRLKEIMKVTNPTERLYKSIQRITEVNEMMPSPNSREKSPAMSRHLNGH